MRGLDPMSVTLRHLRAFESVARLSSFTRAAEELQMSQPALTMAIRQLEDMVGASLFDRTTRRVTLTPEGSDFVPTSQRLLHDFDLAIQDIRTVAKRRRGRVGIASVISIATKILPRAVHEFSQANPTTSVHLRDGNSSDVRRRVRRNEVDIGFASMDRDDPDLDFAPLFRDQVGLLARADHPLLQLRRRLTWADLDGYDFLGLAADAATRPILESVANLPRSVASPRYEVSTQATLEAMLAAGIGITIVPALNSSRSSSAPLQFRQLADPIMWRTIYAITRKGRTLSPAAHNLANMVRVGIKQAAAENHLIEVLEGLLGKHDSSAAAALTAAQPKKGRANLRVARAS
jgi:DNA-binding transcriptional LysR family regulator